MMIFKATIRVTNQLSLIGLEIVMKCWIRKIPKRKVEPSNHQEMNISLGSHADDGLQSCHSGPQPTLSHRPRYCYEMLD